ncbi:MAG: DUF2628 domain-containing protein [Candidatus Marinimicrobia bacterium]|nr:DUF2628 domain-containing protein [Candidatus Neomarinimicrobiota bacterium]
MKKFRVFKNPIGEVKVVKVGWSWPAALFVPFWLFFHGFYLYGIIMFFIDFISVGISHVFIGIFFLGKDGNKILADNLISKGFECVMEVTANNIEMALSIYYKNKESNNNVNENHKFELKKEININEEENSTEKVCTMCAETIKQAAKICRYCSHQFE